MKKPVIQFLCVLLVFGIAATVWAQEELRIMDEAAIVDTQMEQLEDVALNRDLYIADILLAWGTTDLIVQDLETALASADNEQILALSSAESMDEVRHILQGSAVFPEGLDGPTALGDLSEDLVYTPVTPCRIVDTRNVGGPISAGGVREFLVHGTGLNTSQGGDPSCISPIGEPAGVHINITALPQGAAGGYLSVYPSDVTTPSTSSVNYAPGDNIANAITVKTAYLVGNDIEVYTFRQSHVVIDVMGYYGPPAVTPLQAYTTSAFINVAAGVVFNSFSPTCATNYVATGGGCAIQFGGAAEDVNVSRPVPTTGTPTRWLCQGINNEAYAQNITAHVICARVPGR